MLCSISYAASAFVAQIWKISFDHNEGFRPSRTFDRRCWSGPLPMLKFFARDGVGRLALEILPTPMGLASKKLSNPPSPYTVWSNGAVWACL